MYSIRNRDTLVEALPLLQDLVTIPSVSGQEEHASSYLVEQMNTLGYRATVDEVGNAVGIRDCPDKQGAISREIVLLGHIDTVPGDIPVRVEAGCLFGRGTVDAKGPLSTFVMAGAQANLQPGTRLVVIGAVEEETATSKGAWHIVDKYQPVYCIIGEPSGWDAITLGYKGRILFDYHLSQSMSHTAGPDKTVAEHAVIWWNQIQAFAKRYNASRSKVFEQLSPSLREIKSFSNGLENTVEATVGVRIPSGLDLEDFTHYVMVYAGMANVTAYGEIPAYQTTRSNELVRQFSAIFRQAGLRPRLKLKSGTSDMNVVAPNWDCPVIAYGPGDSQLDHTPEEHLVIEDYFQAIAILSQVLSQL